MAVVAMHEEMHGEATQRQQERQRTPEMGAVFTQEIESDHRQEERDGDIARNLAPMPFVFLVQRDNPRGSYLCMPMPPPAIRASAVFFCSAVNTA